MKESLAEAKEELKRIEHIIYVSLKYTRTVDVLRNALNRLISMFDFLIDALVEYAKKEKKFKKIPKTPRLKVELVREAFEEDERILLGKFEKLKYPELMSGLLEEAKRLDDEIIADKDDKEQRLLALMKYA